MVAYISPTRLCCLMIPTLFGAIMLRVTFAVVQFAPGGPVERVIAQLSGHRYRRHRPASRAPPEAISAPRGGAAGRCGDGRRLSKYRGAQGLDPEFIKQLESSSASTSRPTSASFMMLWNYPAASISARAISATSACST